VQRLNVSLGCKPRHSCAQAAFVDQLPTAALRLRRIVKPALGLYHEEHEGRAWCLPGFHRQISNDIFGKWKKVLETSPTPETPTAKPTSQPKNSGPFRAVYRRRSEGRRQPTRANVGQHAPSAGRSRSRLSARPRPARQPLCRALPISKPILLSHYWHPKGTDAGRTWYAHTQRKRGYSAICNFGLCRRRIAYITNDGTPRRRRPHISLSSPQAARLLLIFAGLFASTP
jgi:hypothetical protein